jgi:hypothetical protein
MPDAFAPAFFISSFTINKRFLRLYFYNEAGHISSIFFAIFGYPKNPAE